MPKGREATGAIPKTPKGVTRTRRSRSRKTSDRGGVIHMPTNPPQIHYQPWYRLTVAKSHSGTWEVTPNILIVQIRSQLDPHGHGLIPPGSHDAKNAPLEFRLQVRVLSVRAWNLSGRQIALAVDDFTTRTRSDQEQICGIVDSGTALHVPAVGYKISTSMSNVVLRNDADDKDDVLIHVIAPTGNACMTYIDVDWRFDGPIKLTKDYWFQSDMQKLLNSTDKVKANTINIAESASHIADMVEKQVGNSYIDATINGISKAAEVVAVAGAASLSDYDRGLLERIAQSLDNLRLRPVSEESFEAVEEIEERPQHEDKK